jgi:hypothetical protein
MNNPLLPFAFTRSESGEIALDTTPRDRTVRDANAESMYHTRAHARPSLAAAPSLKRRPGASFSEKDNVKRRELESSDTDASDTDHEATRVDLAGLSAPPSSPPVAMASEIDFGAAALHFDSVPHSPASEVWGGAASLDADWDAAARPRAVARRALRARVRPLNLDADFGLDSFNRFKAPSFGSDDRQAADAARAARAVVLDAFERATTTINLEGMQLREVPDEVKDLDDLVVFGAAPLYQLYLTNNKIRVLPPSLFRFTKLNVLALRQNRLSELPSAVGRLERLTDLYLGTNRLRYLPAAVLRLRHLAVLLAGPNPFLAVAPDAVAAPRQCGAATRRFVAPGVPPRATVPSLRTLCLDAVARYDVLYRETKRWKHATPHLLHPLITRAILCGQYRHTCSQCNLVVVEPYAEVFEWWDILDNKLVPIKRDFCSGRCLHQWRLADVVTGEAPDAAPELPEPPLAVLG